ncbi:hypothetical protein [Streptomyces sp. SID13031]|uniref:hypothetical protein n=1 Tax=Streptomyces sp. SID13031 TaxID=2706046 RepID=UPI0013CAD351|nr:hypothetical protein [Streptomyces sp. SID13031]NEA31852.1 hypothetical protein [Streptomyces sp. SID13031]
MTDTRYTAVWKQSTEGETQVYGWTYEDFKKKYDELWPQGWRLKSLQPVVLPGDQVRYSAVWKQSTEGETQVYGWTYEDFKKKYDELWKQGWRLKLLQPFVLAGNQVRYTAVWKQSTEGETQVYGWTYEDFKKKYDELWKQGWRLKLLQPFVLAGNQVRYTAVWKQSTEAETQVYGWTYDDYRKKYDELWKQGWRLKLLQPFWLAGQGTRYSAVWIQSQAAEIQVYGWSFDDYRRNYDQLWKQGWRLKLLQPYAGDPELTGLAAKALSAYRSTGGVTGPLGLPLGPVAVTAGQARWSTTSGHIIARASGAPEVSADDRVEIHFVGFTCRKESTEFSGSDEPYFVLSHVAPGRAVSSLYKFQDVDKGEEVISPKLLIADAPVITSTLHVAIYENDEGSPSEARRKVEKAMQKAAEAAAQAAGAYDMTTAAAGNAGALSPWAAIGGGLVGGPLGALVAGGIVAAFGLGDDYVGERGATLFDPKDGYDSPPDRGKVGGESYTHMFPISSGGSGSYDVYLRVRKVRDPRPYVV